MAGFKTWNASREYHIETPVDAWVGKVKKQHETLEFNFLKANMVNKVNKARKSAELTADRRAVGLCAKS